MEDKYISGCDPFEDNKYYTPDITEFHVGFQYERSLGNSEEYMEWRKLTMSVNYLTIDDIDDEILVKEIRVKYLDKSDIESCGFIVNNLGHFEKFYPNDLKLDTKWLIWLNDEGIVTIQIYGFTFRCVKFTGKIKNISELKVLLKQIGVTND